MKKSTQPETKQVKGRLAWNYSELLFARPSWLEGVARLFDFGGALDSYNDDGLTTDEANVLALTADWRAIGQDMRTAICDWTPSVIFGTQRRQAERREKRRLRADEPTRPAREPN